MNGYNRQCGLLEKTGNERNAKVGLIRAVVTIASSTG